jgi:hypothetical protein
MKLFIITIAILMSGCAMQKVIEDTKPSLAKQFKGNEDIFAGKNCEELAQIYDDNYVAAYETARSAREVMVAKGCFDKRRGK